MALPVAPPRPPSLLPSTLKAPLSQAAPPLPGIEGASHSPALLSPPILTTSPSPPPPPSSLLAPSSRAVIPIGSSFTVLPRRPHNRGVQFSRDVAGGASGHSSIQKPQRHALAVGSSLLASFNAGLGLDAEADEFGGGRLPSGYSSPAYSSLNNSLLAPVHSGGLLGLSMRYTDKVSLRLHVVTFNMGEATPKRLPPELFGAFRDDADVYAVGSQETCPSADWGRLLSEQLPPTQYVKLKARNLLSIHLQIFVRKDVKHLVTCSDGTVIATGVGNVYGNKGGVAFSLCLAGCNVLLVNCHLAAHDGFVERRNADFHRICAGLPPPLSPGGEQEALAAALAAVAASSSAGTGVVDSFGARGGGGEEALGSSASYSSLTSSGMLPLRLLRESKLWSSVGSQGSNVGLPSRFPPVPPSLTLQSLDPEKSASSLASAPMLPVMGGVVAGSSSATPPDRLLPSNGDFQYLPPCAASSSASQLLNNSSSMGSSMGSFGPSHSHHNYHPSMALMPGSPLRLGRASAAAVPPRSSNSLLRSTSSSSLTMPRLGEGGNPTITSSSGSAGSHSFEVLPDEADLAAWKAAGLLALRQHDVVIWAGDLNYRIQGTASGVKKAAEKGMFEVLMNNDQLKKERTQGRAFQGFHEQEILFPPTFKLRPGTDEYNLKRIPSYTDRILFLCNASHDYCSLRPLYYRSVHEIKDSDHRPVVAGFQLSLSPSNRALSAPLSPAPSSLPPSPPTPPPTHPLP